MAELAVNGAQSTLATAPSGTSGTSLAIQSGDTGKFPSSGNFACLLQDSLTSPTQFEIIEVTAVSGATFTITRASEPYAGSQTAQTWSAGAYITQVATAGTIRTVQIPSYDTTVLTRLSLAPVAYWKLNDPVGSTTAADSSGNGYTLTVSGTVTFGEPSVVPSDSETSAQGDGTTGYLSGGPFALVPTGASPCTVIAACKAPSSSSGAAETIVMLGTDSAVGDDIRLFYYFGQPQYSSITNTTAVYAGLTDGNTHLIGCSYSVAGMQVWFDGTLVGTALFTPNLTSAPVYLLSNNASQMYGSAPTGRVAIFAGVLTPKDWALLMQAFTGV